MRKNSYWYYGILLLLVLDAVSSILAGKFIGFFIVAGMINAVHTKNKNWVEWIVLLYIPLLIIGGLFVRNPINYSGEGMIFEGIVYAVLFFKSWKEFDK